MTKQQTVEAGKREARNDNTVKTVSIEALTTGDLQDYNVRRRFAEGLVSGEVDTKYPNEFRQAFVDEAMSIWGGKIRALENARKNFARAASGISAEQAQKELAAVVDSFRIRGAQPMAEGYFDRLTVRRPGRIEASLYFKFDRRWDDGDVAVNPDDPTDRVYSYAFKVELSTTGTTCSLSQGLAYAELYRELLQLGAELENAAAELRVIYRTKQQEVANA